MKPYELIHILLVFLPNSKKIGATSGLQFLPICWFGEYDVILSCFFVLPREIHSTLNAGSMTIIHPNVRNMYKPANNRALAWFATQLARVLVLWDTAFVTHLLDK